MPYERSTSKKYNPVKSKNDMPDQSDKKEIPRIILAEADISDSSLTVNIANVNENSIFNFSANNLVQGLILSEILGKPKSRRRGR